MPTVFAVVGALTGLGVIAQETGTQDPSSLGWWIQWGVLGAILVLILLGQISPGWVVKAKDAEIEKKDAEIERLRVKIEDEVIPLLTDAVRSLEAVADREGR